jgi:mercuric ion transport protein
LWVAGAFLICPCHLPLTLGIAGAALGGTAAGWFLRHHPVVSGIVVVASWIAATAYGFRLMQNECELPADPTRR